MASLIYTLKINKKKNENKMMSAAVVISILRVKILIYTAMLT